MSETFNKLAYVRTVNKAKIPICTILGVDIAAVDLIWVVQYFEKYIKELSGDYVCVSNVHTTVMSYEDRKFSAIQNGGIMALPDGGPLSTVGRKRGHEKMRRVAGPSLMNEIFKTSEKNGYRHYFYGSTEETLEALSQNLKEKYHGIQIVGICSPPFKEVTEKEDELTIKAINKSNPDFVWVGLGAPKQEKWMAAHQGKITGLMVGVGAGFDYFAGNIKRAPEWMQKLNLEWFYRLMQEPRRLFKRYLITNTKFIWLIAKNK